MKASWTKVIATLMLASALSLVGCTPNLTAMEKSDLLVQAEQVRYVSTDGGKFYSLYEDLLNGENGVSKGDVKDHLKEYLEELIRDKAVTATKTEKENLIMHTESLIDKADLYDSKQVSDIADLIQKFEKSFF